MTRSVVIASTAKQSRAELDEEHDMETVGLGLYFEDLPVGRRFRTIGRTVTEADITNFVNCTGMVEVLFTNTEFLADESDLKGARRRAPWSTPSPRGFWCRRRCSTPASPSCTWS
jgi:acyl dehydratase